MSAQNTPTPHNAAKFGDIAQTVLMPGDPLRAKFIAENYLEDAVLYNEVRGMLGYTGAYKGKRVSVQGHGMGIPSIGIYTYELFNFYGVDRIIRVGSAGGIQPRMQLGDLVIAMAACTDSNYVDQYGLPGSFSPIASYRLLAQAVRAAEGRGQHHHVGNVLASDVFYSDNLAQWAEMGVLAVEMEATALYCNAIKAGKEALCLLTVSDLPLVGKNMSAEERQTGFGKMIELALEIA